MDKVHEPSDSECHTPTSEPFRFYMCNLYGPRIYPSIKHLERLKIQSANIPIRIAFLMRHSGWWTESINHVILMNLCSRNSNYHEIVFFTVITTKITIFWDVIQYSLVDVSEDIFAFVFRTEWKPSQQNSVFAACWWGFTLTSNIRSI
jgi:hypothetical protein